MPKLVDHDERRRQIAAAAARAIDEQGLDKVRLVDVARRASCTTGAVSHYFQDKDAVLGAALDHVLGGLVERLPERATWSADGDPVEMLLDALVQVLPRDESRRRWWRVWIAFCGRAVRSPALAKMHRNAYATLQKDLAVVLVESGIAASTDDAQQLAVAVVAAIDGIGLRAALEPAEWSAARLEAMLRLQLAPLLRAGHALDDYRSLPRAKEKSA